MILPFIATKTFAKSTKLPPSKNITLWVSEGKDSLIAKHAIFIRNQIEERLPKQFQVTIKTAPTTLPEGKILRLVQKGEIDLVLLSNSVVDAVPELSLFRIPWLFQSRTHMQKALYAGLEDELRHTIDKSLEVVTLGVYDNVFHHMRARVALANPETFVNRRILVNAGAKTHKMFRDIGAFPQKYPFSRAGEAIANGTVDSFSGSLRQLTALPIGFQANTITLTRHLFEPAFFIASNKFWISITNRQRAIFTELAVDFSDTAHHLAMTHTQAVRKAIPLTLMVEEINSEAFETLTSTYLKEYDNNFGHDWLEYVETAIEETASD